MSKTTRRIKDLFEEIDQTPFGPAERALVDEAIALAVEAGDEKLEYRARMRLTGSANQSGDTDAMLASFAWCLAKHDSDPERFPLDIGNGGADLLWQYKWMAGTLGASPIFSREQIDAVLHDMHEHYSRAGMSQSGVIMSRFEDAWVNGRIDEAEKWRVELAGMPRDEYSHCDACVRSQSSGFFVETNRDAEAITLVEEMIEGNFSCGDEPEHALSRALLPYLRAGRPADAKQAHVRSYRLARDNPDKLDIVANHLVFCAVTGNEARGLALLERHIGWLAHDGLNAAGHFSALVAIGVLLDAVERAGHGDAVVRGADAPGLVAFFGEHDGTWTAAALGEAAWTAAARLADAFDARNGNEYFAGRITAAKSLAETTYDVPINTDTFLPAPVSRPEPTDAAGWTARARDLAFAGLGIPAIEAARRALEGVTGRDRDEMHSLTIGYLVNSGDLDAAEAALPARIASLRDNGREHQAALEERVGLAVFGRTEPSDRAALEHELANIAPETPPDVVADIRLSLAMLLVSTSEPDGAKRLAGAAADGFFAGESPRGVRAALLFLARCEVADDDIEAALATLDQLDALEPGDGERSLSLLTRARILGGSGDFASGARAADSATRIFTELDIRPAVVDATALAAALWTDAGEPDEAVNRFRFAVRQSELLDQPATGLGFAFGRSLLGAGHAAESVEVLQDVYEQETEAGIEAASRGETLLWLGQALQADEQYGNAVGAWGAAVELFTDGGDSRGAARAGAMQGRLLGRFGETDDALESLSAAAIAARETPDEAGLLTDVLHGYGIAQASAGQEAALETFDEIERIATEHEAAWLIADVTDSRARALSSLGRVDEAIPVALTAADRYAQAGDPASAAGAELTAARMLAQSDRVADAVPIYRAALEREEAIPELRGVAALELGDALESLGRLDEAAEARTIAEGA